MNQIFGPVKALIFSEYEHMKRKLKRIKFDTGLYFYCAAYSIRRVVWIYSDQLGNHEGIWIVAVN